MYLLSQLRRFNLLFNGSFSIPMHRAIPTPQAHSCHVSPISHLPHIFVTYQCLAVILSSCPATHPLCYQYQFNDNTSQIVICILWRNIYPGCRFSALMDLETEKESFRILGIGVGLFLIILVVIKVNCFVGSFRSS